MSCFPSLEKGFEGRVGDVHLPPPSVPVSLVQIHSSSETCVHGAAQESWSCLTQQLPSGLCFLGHKQ